MTFIEDHLYKRCAVLKKERDERDEMVSVLLEKLHEVDRRERYRKKLDKDWKAD